MMITSKTEIPGWLYACWPWLVAIMAFSFGLIGWHWISLPLCGYAVYLFVIRFWRE